VFDLELSQIQAEKRFKKIEPEPARSRQPRSDRGLVRMAPEALDFLRKRLLAYERPNLLSLIQELTRFCERKKLPCPSRASIYKLLDRIEGHRYLASQLPPAVRMALYNLAPDAVVPGHQVAFYCFNYGDLSAVCFASGMPWLDLHQARRLRGWRLKSRGLLEAVCHTRKI
jgi:hypothetical protein